MSTSPVDPHGPTEHAYHGPERRERRDTPGGCELARQTHAMLVGSQEREGVFEQLHDLHAMVRTRGNLIVVGVWVIALCSAISTWGHQ